MRLQHLLRSEQVVTKNNTRIKTAKSKAKAEAVASGGDTSAAAQSAAVPEISDSSLTKPRVIVIAPCRHTAWRCVQMLLELHGEKTVQMKAFRGKFYEEFGPDEEEEGGGRPMRANGTPYPEDYTQSFFGNTDDNFSVGLKMTRKSVKLFSKLQFSDIVIASPLAVRMLVGEHGKGADCLASVGESPPATPPQYDPQGYLRALTPARLSFVPHHV